MGNTITLFLLQARGRQLGAIQTKIRHGHGSNLPGRVLRSLDQRAESGQGLRDAVESQEGRDVDAPVHAELGGRLQDPKNDPGVAQVPLGYRPHPDLVATNADQAAQKPQVLLRGSQEMGGRVLGDGEFVSGSIGGMGEVW